MVTESPLHISYICQMSKPTISFAHANGFPGKVYSRIYQLLETDFNVIFPEMMSHDPRFPVKSGWEEQADELIEFLVETIDDPIIGVGHSFGASITFLAAIKRPDLFKGLILIEPIMFNGFFKYPVALLKGTKYLDRFTPAGKSKFRKRCWQSKAEAEAYFKSKQLFKNFEETSLQGYLEHGLVQSEKGWCLRFEVDHEVEIFRTGPHHFDDYRGRLKELQGVVITADQSNATVPRMIRRFTKQHDFEWKRINGSHLFPLEQIELTAYLIREYATSYSHSIS